MEPPSIVLRPVEESDFDMILEWRNNPDVRRNSINSEKIEKIDNRKYWKLRIADKKAISWIAMTKIENEPVGLVRLDQSDRRGEGIGSTALAAALAKARDMGIRKFLQE